MNKKLSTESYKGVRDFYPEDMAVENHIFSVWKKVAERFGYAEYGASVLEPAELYRAKSGEEIVNEQTYTFKDRGERDVTLRPEMTPTVARMVAGRKRELAFPLRWFSIPNLFRYEQPQRGRLREHWQLNVDLFGVDNANAEIEVLCLASEILREFGMKDSDFTVRLNSRKIMDYVAKDVFALSEENAHKVSKLIDRKAKMPKETFEEAAREIVGDKTASFLTLLNSQNFEEFSKNLPQTATEHEGLKEVKAVIAGLEALGVKNARFDQTLMRGFDYYTGVVFEIFDNNPENRRSIFGGGRYDDLLSIFGGEKVPAVGFGMGDVVAKDLLATYGLLPKAKGPADLVLAPTESSEGAYAAELAQALRTQGIRVAVDFTGRKLGDKFKAADKAGVPFIIALGEQERGTGMMKLKHLPTGKEESVVEEEVKGAMESLAA
jgi:histidyl-tRNA synthetase